MADSDSEIRQAQLAGSRRELVDALEGNRELTWAIWASPLHRSHYLTEQGRHVAEWAVDVLRSFLGDDFLQRVRTAGVHHALLSGALLTTLWPEFDSRRVYEDLIRIAAQLSVCDRPSKGRQKLQTTMSMSFDSTTWTHCLIQFELASLALRHGWGYEFEQTLPKGTPGDVRLEKDGGAIAVEVTTVGMSAPQQEAEAFFLDMMMRLRVIEMQYDVLVRGAIGDVVPPEERDRWIIEVEDAARSTAQDQRERYVPGPAEAAVWVSTIALAPNETHLEGPAGEANTWGRLNARVSLKGRKTAGTGPTWIRLQEHAGLWMSLLSSPMTFNERFAFVAPYMRAMIEPFPHVTGIILSPGWMWMDNEPIEQTVTLPDMPGAVALRRPFAQGRVRETMIVSRSDQADPEVGVFVNLYGQEGSWMEWALEKLGHPTLDELFQ